MSAARQQAALDAVMASMTLLEWEPTHPVVLAKKPLRFEGRRQALYLVQAETRRGRQVGASGPFTGVLPLSVDSLERIPSSKVVRRLLNLYVGDWLVSEAEVASLPAGELSAAFDARSSSYALFPACLEDPAALGASTMMTLSTSRMKLTTADVQGVWIEDEAYAITDIRLAVTLGSEEVVHVVGPHWLRWNRSGELLDIRRADGGALTFPEQPLAHVVGTTFGPWEILNRWGTATLID